MSAIATKLRETIQKLRRTPMPLAEIIPMLISAADELDKTEATLAKWELIFGHLGDTPDEVGNVWYQMSGELDAMKTAPKDAP